MTTASDSPRLQSRYSPAAYQFIFAALRCAQESLGRNSASDDDAHISPVELLDGVRELALSQFGLMTTTVFRQWGIHETADFGRIVFELIERGEMKRTDRDHLSDFDAVYSFSTVFEDEYVINTSHAFRD